MSQATLGDIRPSPIAGQWYPGRAEQLAESIDRLLDAGPQAAVPGTIIGLVAPHAGHIYSGKVAADAFRLVQGKSYKRVIVISPMHSFYPQPVLTTGHEAYWTPLGAIPVDQVILEAIGKKVTLAKVRKDPEHSLEIELPFLQQALSGPFSLVPLMLRDQSYELAAKLGEAIAQVIGEPHGTLLVASSDLSHFYSEEEANALDQVMLKHIETFDPQAVIRADDEGRAFACGRAAIATMLVAARALGADRARIVGYGTSGDASGDHLRVVGYGAAAAYKAA